METTTLRPSREVELPLIGALEKSSDAQFRAAGMGLVADAPVPDLATYLEAHRAGRLLVASSSTGLLVGFVRIEIVDGDAHVEQVSVHPDHQRQGVGRALLEAAEQWARAHDHARMTLTTFRDVPWNGPFYARLGWDVLPEHAWRPELAAARHHERALGLDQWPRQAMFKQVG